VRNFIIIGAQRSGTTSLYRYICAHPAVKPAVRKEIHFFDWQYEKGHVWYRGQLPATGGEASPSYIFDPAVPERVKKHEPDTRLIAILRNPADRAYSQYYHNRKRKTESLSLRQALDKEEKRLRAAIYMQSMEWSYKARGRYAEQLLRWFALFPPEQLLILKAEDLFNYPPETMLQVWKHLELNPIYQSVEEAYLKGTYRAHRRQTYRVHVGTRQYLIDYFDWHNQKLYQLLERDFDWH